MELTIEKIVYPGRSLARKDGQVFFLDQGLPGEIVQVDNLQKKKNFSTGIVHKLISSSSDRIKTKCPHYKICSPFQYITYEKQLSVKKEQVNDIFKDMFSENIDIQPSPATFGYRNKISLKLLWKSKRAFFAYNIRDAHNKFASIDSCFLVSKNLNTILKNALGLINKHKHKEITDIILRENSDGNAHLTLKLSSNRNIAKIKRTFIENALPFLIGVVALFNQNDFTQSINILGKNFITEKVFSTTFSIGPLSFFQINTPMLITVCNDILNNVTFKRTDLLYDLYCGVGTFGILFSDKVKEVVGIETESANTSFFTKNCKDNNINNAQVITSKSEDVCMQLAQTPPNILVMDPPRAGVHKDILKTLKDTETDLPSVRHSTDTIIYLSCDPVTMARDLKILSEKYTITFLKAYDFFPQTPHIESLCILKKHPRKK